MTNLDNPLWKMMNEPQPTQGVYKFDKNSKDCLFIYRLSLEVDSSRKVSAGVSKLDRDITMSEDNDNNIHFLGHQIFTNVVINPEEILRGEEPNFKKIKIKETRLIIKLYTLTEHVKTAVV